MRIYETVQDQSALSNAQLRELIALEDMSIVDPDFDDETYVISAWSRHQFDDQH